MLSQPMGSRHLANDNQIHYALVLEYVVVAGARKRNNWSDL